jgi:hypothetical protein
VGIIVFTIDKHAISKGEETIFFLNGFLVAMEGPFPAHEGGNEHDQSALRKVEIGD